VSWDSEALRIPATAYAQTLAASPFKMSRLHIIRTMLLTGLLFSFDTVDEKLKSGYYLSTHGHATTVFQIKGTSIEWYNQNAIRDWGQGKYKINKEDSVIEITFEQLWTSQEKKRDEEFESKLKIKWDNTDNVFVLRDYEFRENSDWIKNLKKNVKSSCKIGVKRASR
jgi:hypothetical protein